MGAAGKSNDGKIAAMKANAAKTIREDNGGCKDSIIYK
jgi:hypothetical protein